MKLSQSQYVSIVASFRLVEEAMEMLPKNPDKARESLSNALLNLPLGFRSGHMKDVAKDVLRAAREELAEQPDEGDFPALSKWVRNARSILSLGKTLPRYVLSTEHTRVLRLLARRVKIVEGLISTMVKEVQKA